MEIENITYPDMNGLEKWANPLERISISERLIGKTIFWEIKRDGSNVGAYLDAAGQIQLRTRNQIYAEPQIKDRFLTSASSGNIVRALQDAYTATVGLVIFGEWMSKGKSPSRFEQHDVDTFEVFDIWNDVIKQWMPADERHLFCQKYGIKEVDTLMVSSPQVTHSLDNIYKIRNTLLEQCKKEGKEGVVGKVYLGKFINFFKEKNEKPVKEKSKTVTDADQRPELPESEVRGAVNKAKVDLGDQFYEIGNAMPLIAKYIQIECEKHDCKFTGKLIRYYKEQCENR